MHDIAQSILQALDEKRQIDPISQSLPSLDLDTAYGIADAILATRSARGQRPVGWKIGFTNRTIWDEYGVHAPIWGPVYDATVLPVDPDHAPAELDIEAFVEPRIEPEIIFRLAHTPRSEMDDRELLACIDGVSHGFEIVQSIFPGWRFSAADTVAAAALHGALVHGPFASIDHSKAGEWIDRLAAVAITLLKDGTVLDHGVATNVLDGPLSALRHFLAGLEARPLGRGVLPGDLVSTGTITRAFPIAAGEIWSTQIDGLPLPAMRLKLFGGTATLDRLIDTAAQGRFHLENPDSCTDSKQYEQKVAEGTDAEAMLAKLLHRDPLALAQARHRIEADAQSRLRAWKQHLSP